MKKAFFFMLFALSTGAFLQAQIVTVDNFDGLEVRYFSPQLTSHTVSFNGEKHTAFEMDGYINGGYYGAPALPVRTDLITIPFCQSVSVEVTDAVYDTLDFAQTRFYPLQPSRSKSQLDTPMPVVDSQCYSTDSFFGMPTAHVEVQGIARDRRLATLTFSPVRVNPVSGQVILCRQATVKVSYVNSDVQSTLQHFDLYHSPAFSSGQTLNSLLSTKDVAKTAPVRMVIVAAGALRCHSLASFADWKRRQGMIVDIAYTDEQGLSSNTKVATYLSSLYTNASAEAPAPTYVLLVGDHSNLPAFNSRMTDGGWGEPEYSHITDLYFTTWTSGDIIPDCYIGRFSAIDTVTLGYIVNKTLLYESYSFADDSYLGRAVLVAGEDNGTHQTSGWTVDNAWIYCDPTMDYLAKLYVNAANGFDEVVYYKNNVNYAPDGVTVSGYCSDNNAPSALRNLYDNGVGLINYSAHGDWDRWYKPSFSITHVGGMSNTGKPSVMIGNCCLSNKFDRGVCFGESLLRRENAGAVAYFGATNSTYWAEDFYWTVGVRSNISNAMNAAYSANQLGMYDCLFHTHNEASSSFAATAGSMLFSGNLSVNTASSSQLSSSQSKLYYWEIYELMGDPSLLPWLGRASTISAHCSRSAEAVTVSAPAYSYVAIVDTTDLSVVSAAFANGNGVASLPVSQSFNLDYGFLSITAQGYKPYFKSFSDSILGLDNADVVDVSVRPNPASDRCMVAAEGLRRVDVLDLMGRQLVSLSAVDGVCNVDLQSFNEGFYLLRVHHAGGVSMEKLLIRK